MRYCSPEECAYRQRTGDVHMLEATDETRRLPVNRRVADARRIVKKFVRSGSSELHKSYAPRTLAQLQATVMYLLHSVWWVRRGDAAALPVVYAFVADRVQAVRQDVITDNHFQADSVAVVSLFEQLVRFYVDSMHVALGTVAPPATSGPAGSGAPPLSGWFDLHLHESALSSCIATCLGFCAQRPGLLVRESILAWKCVVPLTFSRVIRSRAHRAAPPPASPRTPCCLRLPEPCARPSTACTLLLRRRPWRPRRPGCGPPTPPPPEQPYPSPRSPTPPHPRLLPRRHRQRQQRRKKGRTLIGGVRWPYAPCAASAPCGR